MNMKVVTRGHIAPGSGVVGGEMSSMPSPMLTGPFETGELPRIAGDAVTVTVARRVLAGREADFEAWAERVGAAMEPFDGFLGSGVLAPREPGGEYHIVFRFIDAVCLRIWERSEERRVLLAELAPLVADTRVNRTVGEAQWFALPDHAPGAHSKGRRLLHDVAWVYPVALTVSLASAPFFARFPIGARVLFSTAIMTTLISFAVGPARTKIRRRRTL